MMRKTNSPVIVVIQISFINEIRETYIFQVFSSNSSIYLRLFVLITDKVCLYLIAFVFVDIKSCYIRRVPV